MFTFQTILIILQLIFLEGVLSIDNAAVLGAIVSKLPKDKPVPWPKTMSFLHTLGDGVFGNQRSAALKVGILGAYLGRGIMLVLAAYVINNSLLRFLGAAYLFKLAIDNLSSTNSDEDVDVSPLPLPEPNFWQVVVTIELADLAFSLDNVVAAVALSPRILVVMLGVAIGIVVMRFAAQLFTHLIEHEPALISAAYIVVLMIGLELMIESIGQMTGFEVHFQSWQKSLLSILIMVLSVIYSRSPNARTYVYPYLLQVKRVLNVINTALNSIVKPFSSLFTKKK